MNDQKFSPDYRFQLRSQIAAAGFRTITEFSKAVGVDVSRISRIVSGWEYPSPKLARAMADALSITPKELKELL
ncbi:helix-turn-helix domain-containing protein [Thermodesulfobacteriota bacterium]